MQAQVIPVLTETSSCKVKPRCVGVLSSCKCLHENIRWSISKRLAEWKVTIYEHYSLANCEWSTSSHDPGRFCSAENNIIPALFKMSHCSCHTYCIVMSVFAQYSTLSCLAIIVQQSLLMPSNLSQFSLCISFYGWQLNTLLIHPFPIVFQWSPVLPQWNLYDICVLDEAIWHSTPNLLVIE